MTFPLPTYEEVLNTRLEKGPDKNEPPRSEQHAQLLQEIQDTNFNSYDNEYSKLKMKEYYKRRAGIKCSCPHCGIIYSFQSFQRGHLRKCAEQTALLDIKL